jgi:hypothetical protein
MGCRGRVGALILLMLSARPVMADLAPGQPGVADVTPPPSASPRWPPDPGAWVCRD